MNSILAVDLKSRKPLGNASNKGAAEKAKSAVEMLEERFGEEEEKEAHSGLRGGTVWFGKQN